MDHLNILRTVDVVQSDASRTTRDTVSSPECYGIMILWFQQLSQWQHAGQGEFDERKYVQTCACMHVMYMQCACNVASAHLKTHTHTQKLKPLRFFCDLGAPLALLLSNWPIDKEVLGELRGDLGSCFEMLGHATLPNAA